MVDLTSQEGRAFAQFHQVGSVTLMFFADGKKLTTLSGEHSASFLRRAFDRAFQLN